jgi:hypothetical protein
VENVLAEKEFVERKIKRDSRHKHKQIVVDVDVQHIVDEKDFTPATTPKSRKSFKSQSFRGCKFSFDFLLN